MPDFLDVVQKLKKNNTKEIVQNNWPVPNSTQNIQLSHVDLNILHNIAGYIITSIVNSQRLCKLCSKCVSNFQAKLTYYNKLRTLKNFKQDTLFFVNKRTFHFFIEMEKIFRSYDKSVFESDINLRELFINKFKKITYTLPKCHKLKNKIDLSVIINNN